MLMGTNLVYSLPTELIRIIYEYDNTYNDVFKKCINEASFLMKTYPIDITKIYSDDEKIAYRKHVLTSEIDGLNKFILNSSLRKKTLRSYRAIKN